MIRLSNGHTFDYMAASGAYSFDGRGWWWEILLSRLAIIDPSLMTVVAKTVTMEPRKGNLNMLHPWSCIRLIKDGAVNAVGLTNPGIKRWCLGPGLTLNHKKAPVLASIMGSPDELEYMAGMLNYIDVLGVEINASCPNTGEDLANNVEDMILGVCKVKETTKLPIILKLSKAHEGSFERIVGEVRGKVEAISLNSVPWKLVFPEKVSPLARLGGGGVSGKIVQPILWPLVQKLSGMTDIPIIGPSVWEFEDMARLREMGAKAVSFGTVCLSHPFRPTCFIRREVQTAGQTTI